MPAQELPDTYLGLDDVTLISRIKAVKESFGQRLILLAHHYQRQEIVDLADFVGDSYDLSLRATEYTEAKFIVFCGVRFMAESAAILTQSDQIVVHPDVNAGCPLADMADIDQVNLVWQQLAQVVDVRKIMPIVYINSDSQLKAFCGRQGGAVCTSSNAMQAIQWGLAQRRQIFFFPDANLGENTASNLRIPATQVIRWNADASLGGQTAATIQQAKLILWHGYCHVHTFFKPEHLQKIRQKYAGVQIIVHPECSREVVAQSDFAGSTKALVEYVRKAPAGSTIAVGTEVNLVERLAQQYPDKKILPLAKSACPNMWKVSLNDLCWVMENLGQVNVVTVSAEVIQFARVALQNMLVIGKK